MTTRNGILVAALLCTGAMGAAHAEGKAASRLVDMMLYDNQAYGVTFAQYDAPTAVAGVIGLPTKARPRAERESTVHVRSEGAPGLGPRDGTLARALAAAFCAHHGLTVDDRGESQFQTNGVWTFRNLCLDTPDVQGS